MSYTLCVIDMQHYFEASRGKRVQQSCVREIKKAMRDQATILYVEYNSSYYGTTLPLLTDLTKNAKYKKAYHVSKFHDGGGDEVVQFLTKRHLPKMNLRVCGVNTNYCVHATVRGINTKLSASNIHIIADACDSNNVHQHKYGLESMKMMNNVKILRNKGWV